MAVRQITTRLAIDGEQEYKKQLAAVNRELGNLGAEMKLVDAQFKGQANSSEALRAKHNQLKQSIEQQTVKVESLKDALEEAKQAYTENDARTDSYRRQLLSAETALAKLNSELSENDKLLKEAENSADGCAKSIDGYGKAVKDAAGKTDDLDAGLGGIGGALKGLRNEDGSFNLGGVTSALGNLKSLLVGGAIVTGAKAVKDAIFEIVESTAEYRKIMGTLEVSSAAAGYTAEETAQVYQELQAVLGDTQTAATATANLQALGLAQEDLKALIDEVIGAWATYGDSIPIDSLSEAINETVQAGKVTGVFADVLNWAGVNEDEFNEKLAACADQSERAQLVLVQLANQGLRETGQAWKDANQDIMEMNRSQEALNAAMARLGELLTPIAAGIIGFTAAIVEGVTAAITAISDLISKIREAREEANEKNVERSSTSKLSRYRAEARLREHLSGSHAAGLDRVPYDGYLAELHADEAVLNAQEAALWRSVGRSGARALPAAYIPAALPANAQSAARRESVTIDVTLELDGQTLARKQYPLMQAESRRRGKPLAGKEGT
nr:MAG TPA: minor tail protein [Caudoviricetes sp.]